MNQNENQPEIEKKENPEKNNPMPMAISSAVFGILSCLGNVAWGWGSMICLVLSIVGTLLAINANKIKSTAPGIVGLISSIIGLLVSGSGTACFICASVGTTALVGATACGIFNLIH